jgi:hypothetical protein
LFVVALLLMLVCKPTPTESPAPNGTKTASSTSGESAAPSQSRSIGELNEKEIWEVCYIQGMKVGYAWTRISRVELDGQPVAKIEWVNRLSVRRFGERTEMETRLTSHQSVQGGLLDFESEMAMGPAPIRTRGRVEGDRLVMDTVSQGQTRRTSIPWSADNGGFYAVEQSLLARPMQPGERRTIRTLVPAFNEVATVELIARTFQPVRLRTGAYRLLRIENTMRFPGAQAIKGTMWVDRTGEVLKTRMAAMEQETFRATKSEALDETELGGVDLGSELAVPVNPPLKNPRATKQVRYRVHLKDGDPAGVFVMGSSQNVVSTGPNTAEITVYALRPGKPPAGAPQISDPPTADDREPNSMIQSDDPTIVALAKKLVGDKTDAWAKAVALERGVHDLVSQKNFSQAFATAAEVARSKEGDCTEHAVLLAALARAVGLPARAAIGLVYMEPSAAFGYHMWTEVYIGDAWIPLDATLATGGIGADHLKLAHASLKDAAGYSSFLPVIQVMGRMKIEVVE